MDRSQVQSLITRYGIVSDQVNQRELGVILEELAGILMRTSGGSVVELGCYIGTTSLYIQRLLQQFGQREFHVYDSFAGLPDKTSKDSSPAGEQFKTGELSAAKKVFITHFKKAGLPLPRIHKSWFNELTDKDIPDSIVFAFLDGDYYESIKDSLKLIWPKLVPGAIVIIDDYMNESLPGAATATDEWLQAHPAKLRTAHSLAVIQV